MNKKLRSSLAGLVTIASLAGLSSIARADDPGQNVCDGVAQDKAACMREKGAAREQARAGNLPSGDPATLRRNAMARCAAQPASDRAACEARVTGAGDTTTRGSVSGGGKIRTTVTPVPAGSQ